MRGALKTIIGIILAPAALAAAWITAVSLAPVMSGFSVTFPLLCGALASVLLHFAGKGRRLYIMSHELTHALAAVFSGVRVRKISVKRQSGYVLLDSTNAFISLAPYFIPFYTLAAGAAYWTAGRFRDVSALRPWFLVVAGFTLAFHLLHTADVLSGPVQSDLRKAGGPVFSMPLLVLLNSLGLAAALKLLFPELIHAGPYCTRVLSAQGAAYRAIFSAASYAVNTARIYLKT
jgi:hypothetical protein